MPVRLAPDQLYTLLPKGSITSLLCTEPAARNHFVNALVFSLLKDGKRVVYFDIDSFFTSFVMRSGILPPKLLLIYPKGEEIDDALMTLLSWTKPVFDLLVIDSATTFYHIFPQAKFSGRNRKLGFYFALLREYTARASSPTLITSHQIYRKIGADWSTSYSGGRVLDYHSGSLLQISLLENSLSLQVTKGPLEGNGFEISVSQITPLLETLYPQKR